MNTLLSQVQQTLQDFRMVESGETLLVAVSGGPDSMAMLHALWQLRDCLGLHLIAAHLNHRMRANAPEDARFVEAVADDLGIACVCKTIDVPAYQRRHRLSPEDAARRVRYAFLRATAEAVQAHRIAVGHTADDQAETVLLRLLRGAGLRGLGGIPPVRDRIIRPLIRVPRCDIMAFLTSQRIPFREDPSNRQRHYLRNRLRLDLMPQLKKGYNPRLVETLCRTAHLVAADEAALQDVARARFEAMRLHSPIGQVHLPVARLRLLPPALQRRVLRQGLRAVGGGLREVTYAHIAAMLRLLETAAGSKRLMLPHGVVIERRYEVLLIQRQVPSLPFPVDEPLDVPGQRHIAALDLTVVSALHRPEAYAGPLPRGDHVWLDASKVGQQVRVRTRRPGDRFQPLGSAYLKKLKAVLIDAKIPCPVRDRLPLVVTARGIAWVVGVQIAEWAKVTAATEDILSLHVKRHTPETPRRTRKS